jgi:methyltransferase
VRHPNYLVVIVEFITLPLLGGAVGTALVFSMLNGLILRRRIAVEEAALMDLPAYREAFGGVGRFIPSNVLPRFFLQSFKPKHAGQEPLRDAH